LKTKGLLKVYYIKGKPRKSRKKPISRKPIPIGGRPIRKPRRTPITGKPFELDGRTVRELLRSKFRVVGAPGQKAKIPI